MPTHDDGGRKWITDAELRRVIAHHKEALEGSAEVGDDIAAAFSQGVIHALMWILGENEPFAEMTKTMDLVDMLAERNKQPDPDSPLWGEEHKET